MRIYFVLLLNCLRFSKKKIFLNTKLCLITIKKTYLQNLRICFSQKTHIKTIQIKNITEKIFHQIILLPKKLNKL